MFERNCFCINGRTRTPLCTHSCTHAHSLPPTAGGIKCALQLKSNKICQSGTSPGDPGLAHERNIKHETVRKFEYIRLEAQLETQELIDTHTHTHTLGLPH